MKPNAPLCWHDLTSGPYQVGFQSGFCWDTSRTYDLVADALGPVEPSKSPRPILLAIWYPVSSDTSGIQMPYQTYFSLPTAVISLGHFFTDQSLLSEVDASAFANFAQRLADHHRNNLCSMLFDCEIDQLGAADHSSFQEFLRTETAAIYNAPPASDKFPLVIYHPGLQGGYEENSVLAEYLASQGYVVVSSAYQPASGAYLSINSDHHLSQLDIGCMIAAMRQTSIIDWQQIAVIGHSYGAQAGLHLRAENDIVDAVISLDSTMDYDKWLQPEQIDKYMKQRRQFKVPMLVVAEGQAEFTLARTLRYAERYLLRMPDVEHDDFLAHQTVLAKGVADAQLKEIDRKCEQYAFMCRYIHRFLDATLRQKKAVFKVLSEVTNEDLTVKQTVSFEYLAADPPPPELKHLLSRLASEGAQAAIKWCRSQTETDEPFFKFSDLNLIGYELIEAAKPAEAVALFEYAVALYPDQHQVLHSLAEAYQANHNHTEAVTTFEQALSLILVDDTLSVRDKAEWQDEILAEINKLKVMISQGGTK